MGWGGDHTAWAFQIPAWAAEFDVIALDNRGAGQSDGIPDAGHMHFIEQASTFNEICLEFPRKHRA
jgi:pimeloyl-ACP methyl ester carboxylesterase